MAVSEQGLGLAALAHPWLSILLEEVLRAGSPRGSRNMVASVCLSWQPLCFHPDVASTTTPVFCKVLVAVRGSDGHVLGGNPAGHGRPGGFARAVPLPQDSWLWLPVAFQHAWQGRSCCQQPRRWRSAATLGGGSRGAGSQGAGSLFPRKIKIKGN